MRDELLSLSAAARLQPGGSLTRARRSSASVFFVYFYHPTPPRVQQSSLVHGFARRHARLARSAARAKPRPAATRREIVFNRVACCFVSGRFGPGIGGVSDRRMFARPGGWGGGCRTVQRQRRQRARFGCSPPRRGPPYADVPPSRRGAFAFSLSLSILPVPHRTIVRPRSSLTKLRANSAFGCERVLSLTFHRPGVSPDGAKPGGRQRSRLYSLSRSPCLRRFPCPTPSSP